MALEQTRLGDVLEHEQKARHVFAGAKHLARIQLEDPAAKPRKVVLHLEPVEGGAVVGSEE